MLMSRKNSLLFTPKCRCRITDKLSSLTFVRLEKIYFINVIEIVKKRFALWMWWKRKTFFDVEIIYFIFLLNVEMKNV